MSIELLQEEVEKIQELRVRAEELTASLGSLGVQKLRLELQEQALKAEVADLWVKEQSLTDELVAKYGPVTIDLQSKIATPIT